MPAKPLRPTLAAIGMAIVVAAALLLILDLLNRPKPTQFGWAAELTTVAGDGERGFADGPAIKARFSDPFGVALDAKGALYVADAGETNRIRRIERDGRTTTLPGAFDTPSGVAVDSKGNVYVADTGANLIRKIAADGAISTLAGDGTAGFRDGPAAQARFNGPIGVAVDENGHVYVADTYNDRIRLIEPNGQVKTLAGGPQPGFADGIGASAAFHTPCGLSIGPDGALLIADTGNNAVRRVSQHGAVTTLAQGGTNDPTSPLIAPIGIAITADGYVYVGAYRRGQVLQLSPAGELRILTGRDASAAENRELRLARPAGLAIDRQGSLYVAEAARYTIRKLAPRRRGQAVQALAAEFTPSKLALLSAATVAWPLAPQGSWHEVVGDMGEVRGADDGESRDHLHAGLDVRGDVGQTVLAMADEKVVSPLPARGLNGVSEGLQIDQLTYIHMRVGRTPAEAPLDTAHFQLLRDPAGKLTSIRIKRGTRIHVGDPLGTVNRMAHVHLELGARGGEANPMGLHLPGLTDHVAPRIAAIQLLDGGGRPLTERLRGRLVVPRGVGALSIVVDAWDQVDGDSPHRRLGLYRAGYSILKADGSPANGFARPLINIEFDRLPVEADAPKIAYAPESGETVHGASETRFLYVVSNRVRGGHTEVGGWSPAGLTPGDYTLRVYAADYAGNEALQGRDVPITVR